MEFKNFKTQIQDHFNEMVKNAGRLYEVDLDKDALWNLYLDSFPAGTNEIFRERREYDCSCCHNFIRNMGNVVVIHEDNSIESIWDIHTDCTTFGPVATALSEYVKKHYIKDIFVSKIRQIGVDKNYETTPQKTYEWQHLCITLPDGFVDRSRLSEADIKGSARDIKNVFYRSLSEISQDAVETVLELIAQGSLYKGEEWKAVLEKFLRYKREFMTLSEQEKSRYAWREAPMAGVSVAKIRNHSIGTLLVNISEGVDLDTAVKKYEVIVAPSNYKRPKAIYTQKMLDEAKKTITELGYMSALQRRFATLDDISVNNILFSNKDAAQRIAGGADIFEEMSKSVAVDPKRFSKVEEISIKDFIENVLPIAKELEVFLENKHAQSFVSLIAPQDADSKNMFKWNNNFGWAYAGNITDSEMKENVKNAGGKVDGVLRFSIQWNDEDIQETCDLDAHCILPGGEGINYSHKLSRDTKGELDVDIINPRKGVAAVENITWPSLSFMDDGNYQFFIDRFSGGLRGTVKAEIEFNGEVHSFVADATDFDSRTLNIATVNLKNGVFTIKPSLKSNASIQSKEIWGVETNQFLPVSVMMHSPNYWDEQEGIGHKHYFFMLKGCVNEERPNGFYNEYLKNELTEHKRVFEALGAKMAVADVEDQLSGIGFSSTKRADLIVKVKGATERILKIKF